jgi:hypothetical protein
MLAAHKGDKIVCPNGHVCGQLDEDVPEDGTILPTMLQLDLFERVDFTDSADAHFCKACNEPITEVRGGIYSAHSTWLDRQSPMRPPA